MTKKSLKVQAYNNLKEKILNCEFSPGMHLNEAVLCETFHVSRTPIRDALSRLEQEGLVTIRSKKGIVVSSLSISEVNNIFELRLLLEPYSIRNYGYTLDEGTLLDYYQNLLRLDITQDAKTFFILDDNFHSFLNSAVPNHYIQEYFRIINNQNQRFRIITGQRAEQRLEDTRNEHLAIIKACIKKEWQAAADAMYEHLLQSKNATFELLLNRENPVNESPAVSVFCTPAKSGVK